MKIRSILAVGAAASVAVSFAQDSGGEAAPAAPAAPAEGAEKSGSDFEGPKPTDKPEAPLSDSFENPFKSYKEDVVEVVEKAEKAVSQEEDPAEILMSAVTQAVTSESVTGVIRASNGVMPKVIINDSIFGLDDEVGIYEGGAFIPAVPGAKIQLVNIGEKDLVFRVQALDIDRRHDVALNSFLWAR